MLNRRVLGRTGFEISEISLGAWAIGGRGYGPVTDREALNTIARYVDAGGNFIDTARAYGESERLIGKFFQNVGGRDRVFICSKSRHEEASVIQADLEETLRQLQCDYVDLYYLHSPPDEPDEMNRVLDIYERLKQAGKIRAIGASIKGPNVTQKTVDLCRQYIRSGRVDALQVIFSILRQKNREMFQEAHESGVGIVVRTALESGFLTGKYIPGHRLPANDHPHRWGPRRLEQILTHAQELQQSTVAPPFQTLSQVALRFAVDQPGVSTIIVGAKSARQVDENFAVGSLPSLSAELQARLVNQYGNFTEMFNTGD
jgi:aryl-alcohol dehydrogenase-like predicted oxidoreductase